MKLGKQVFNVSEFKRYEPYLVTSHDTIKELLWHTIFNQPLRSAIMRMVGQPLYQRTGLPERAVTQELLDNE